MFNSMGIRVRNDAELNVQNCEFVGGSSAIQISPIAKSVIVKDSLFKNCGKEDFYAYSAENACIQIIDDYSEVRNFKNEVIKEAYVELKCDGNVFEDNLCYPIAERAEADFANGGGHVSDYIGPNQCLMDSSSIDFFAVARCNCLAKCFDLAVARHSTVAQLLT